MLTRILARVVGPACLAVVLTVPLTAGAVTWPVGPGDSIATALDGAAYGDTVLVTCHDFEEQGLVLPDGVVLMGETGLQDCTTILSTGGESILTCAAPGTDSRVVGIRFAALDLSDGVTQGAGVVCLGSSPTFEQCGFLALVATYGGAVFCADGSPRFIDCQFVNNQARTSGGALACVGDSSPVLERCLLDGNRVGVTGSAVNAALGATPSLISCTLVGNEGTALAGWNEGGISVDRAIVAGGGDAFVGDHQSVPSFVCSDIWGNTTDWTGLITDQEGIDGNFSADPLFCPDGTAPLAFSLVETSPCAPAQNPGCGLIGFRDVGCDESVGIDDQGGDDPPDDTITPAVTRLQPSFPNPFNPHTTVRFDLRRAGPVRIRVYDAAGRLVHDLLDEYRTAGTHDVSWAGQGNDGRTVAAGVYFIRLEGDGRIDTRRVALVK